MTRTTNARIAGFAFLVYIAAAFPSMILLDRATREGIAAQLASIAQHATDVRVAVVLVLVGRSPALVLAVTLYAITRDQDPDLAMLALTCRVAEGIIGMVYVRGRWAFSGSRRQPKPMRRTGAAPRSPPT